MCYCLAEIFFKVSTPLSEIMGKKILYRMQYNTNITPNIICTNIQLIFNMLTKLYIILTMEHSTKNQTLLLKEVLLNG